MNYKKGDRIEVTECDEYQKETYNYDVGYKGTINEDQACGLDIPFILFDDVKANYNPCGTSVPVCSFKLIDND